MGGHLQQCLSQARFEKGEVNILCLIMSDKITPNFTRDPFQTYFARHDLSIQFVEQPNQPFFVFLHTTLKGDTTSTNGVGSKVTMYIIYISQL